MMQEKLKSWHGSSFYLSLFLVTSHSYTLSWTHILVPHQLVQQEGDSNPKKHHASCKICFYTSKDQKGSQGRKGTQGGETRTIDGWIDALYFLCVQTCLIYIGVFHIMGCVRSKGCMHQPSAPFSLCLYTAVSHT